MKFRVMCWLAVVSALSASSPAAQESTAVGEWRGESKCLVTQSACHDEDSVYRIAPVEHSETKLTITGNRIADGKEVNMGTSECSFSPATHALKCPLPNGSIVALELKGDALNGTMTLPDGTVWRKIALRRVPAKRNP